MAIEKVQVINNPAFKTGIGKNGKPWTMAQITTDKNNLASVFMPIEVGDSVEMTWNDQYGNWSAKRVNAAAAQAQNAQMEALRKIYELNLAIYAVVAGQPYSPGAKVAADQPVDDVPTIDVDEPELDVLGQPQIPLSDIPF